MVKATAVCTWLLAGCLLYGCASGSGPRSFSYKLPLYPRLEVRLNEQAETGPPETTVAPRPPMHELEPSGPTPTDHAAPPPEAPEPPVGIVITPDPEAYADEGGAMTTAAMMVAGAMRTATRTPAGMATAAEMAVTVTGGKNTCVRQARIHRFVRWPVYASGNNTQRRNGQRPLLFTEGSGYEHVHARRDGPGIEHRPPHPGPPHCYR